MNIKASITENLDIKVLSLFLALVLWLFITMGTDGEVDVTVPVQFKNLSPQLSIKNQTPPFLYLRVAGPKILVWRLNSMGLTASLDLRGVGEGSVAYSNPERTVNLSSGLRVTRIYPAALEVKLVKKPEGDLGH